MEAVVLANTNEMSHEEWLAARRKGIGGSDIAAIVGLNKYKSPIQVYLDKIGELPEEETGEAAYWGTVLEEVVAKEFSKRTGLKVKRRNAILRHKKYPYFLANVDRLIVGRKEGLECKTASEYLKDQWNEESVPDAYFVQCQWYMAITGFQKWHLAVLIGGNKFRMFEIERDDELIAILERKAYEFWNNHVIPKVPPAFDGSQASSDLLAAMYPEHVEESIDLPEYFAEKLKRRDELKAMIDELAEEKKAIENEIKSYMGEKKYGFVAGRKITWTRYTVEKFDKDALKRDHPDIYAKYVTEGRKSQFVVK
ncbi:YqaJ viral recombinase family protein [Parageobacillus thermoglucosidasius]|uniref:YqaJ viral recombinase family nuclease n=1 Tax=Parageobacillus thermoglucosidasius TaxID=1426 RepID=UPI003B66D492